MANLLAVPSPVLGLIGRLPRQQNPLLQLTTADAGDEWFLNPQARPQGAGVPVLDNGQIGFDTTQPAQRQRVNPLNVLFRGLAPNLSGALDAERARLQIEADAPRMAMQAAENERIARALGPQALLAFRTSPEKLGESLSYGYRPQVIGQGGVQSVAATGQRVSAPKDFTAGTGVYRSDPLSPALQQLGEIGPSYAEMNAAERNRIDALGAGQSTVGRYRLGPDGQPIFEAPREYTLGQGQTRYEDGSVVASAPTAAADPAKAEARREAALTTISNARSAVNDAMRQVSWRSTGWASGLPFNAQQKADLERTADTIEANLSFAELQKMREASPTGGALGGIAIRELELLGSTVASLKTSQSPEQFQRNLEKVNAHLTNWEQAVRQAQQQGGYTGNIPPLPRGFVLD